MKAMYLTPSVEVMQVEAYALLQNVSGGGMKGVKDEGQLDHSIDIY